MITSTKNITWRKKNMTYDKNNQNTNNTIGYEMSNPNMNNMIKVQTLTIYNCTFNYLN